MPVFAKFDARRKLHAQAHAEQPTWPVIPMSSIVEQMGVYRKPLGAFARRSPAAEKLDALWQGIDRKLTSDGTQTLVRIPPSQPSS